MLASERVIQRAVLQEFRARGYQPVHVPNGAHLAGGKVERAKQMAALIGDGLRPGFPDAIIIGRGRFGTIEMKRQGVGEEGLSPDQVWWRDELRRLGIPWALCNRADGCRGILADWGWL